MSETNSLKDEERLKRWFENRREKDLKYFMEKYHTPLQLVLFKLIGNYEDASDLLQNLWIKIFETETMTIPNNFKSYLMTAARNIAIDYIRRENRRNIIPMSKSVEVIDPQQPDNLLEKQDETIEVKGKELFYNDLFAIFSSPKKEIAPKLYLQEANIDDIAEEFNLDRQQVIKHKSRIKKGLVKEIKKKIS